MRLEGRRYCSLRESGNVLSGKIRSQGGQSIAGSRKLAVWVQNVENVEYCVKEFGWNFLLEHTYCDHEQESCPFLSLHE